MVWPLFQWSLLLFIHPAANTISLNNTQASVVRWVTEQDHDFGNMKQGKPDVFVFQFENTYSDTILLQTVRTSCGCTAASWTESPIAPGDKGEVRIEYDAYQNGDFDKKIRVFFDLQRKPEILRIRGTVE